MRKSVITLWGTAGATVKVTVTDTKASISDAVRLSGGKPAVCVLINVETNGIRFAFGGTSPTQGAGATGHLASAGQALEISGGGSVKNFQYINAINASVAVLQITPYFE